jgi:thiol-disulfide isomerase/thioredoxin
MPRAQPLSRRQICRAFGALALSAGASSLLGDEKVPARVPDIKTLDPSRAGQDVLGAKFPNPPKFTRTLVAEDPVRKADDKPVRATLYRWWTNGCPFCATTLPAIETLRKKYAAAGLRVVGVYHPKPPRDVTDEEVRQFARRIGYHGEIAIDQEWAVLKETYLNKGKRTATSISLLVDADNVIRFVHPGTEYFPSDKPEEKQENQDYQLLEKAIASLVVAT